MSPWNINTLVTLVAQERKNLPRKYLFINTFKNEKGKNMGPLKEVVIRRRYEISEVLQPILSKVIKFVVTDTFNTLILTPIFRAKRE